MTGLLVAVLAVALLVCLRLLAKQRRRLRDLRDAVRSSQPLLHEEGNNSAARDWHELAGAVNDLITENAQLRQQRSGQLAQLEATLGNLREAVLIVDEGNRIHLANRALREIFPKARDLTNLRLELIARSADLLDYVRATRAGQPLPRQEFELVDGDKTTWIEVSGAPISSPEGRPGWALFVIHDMTQQRGLERLRRDFVANASHELRTPLSIIKGYIETLVDGHASMPPADREKFLRIIQRHSERLSSIIADLLTLSRLESATPGLELARIDLRGFLGELAADFAERARASGHELVFDLPDEIGELQGDAGKLTQAVGNLLDNALKYSPSGSRVEVSVRSLDSPAEIEIAVRDNGPGIPPSDLPHVFERFFRVEKGRARTSGGTGLGLSIVKHIVQLHGGRAWAESTLGQGTTVLVRLPCGGANAAA